jgi:hypothetical protein
MDRRRKPSNEFNVAGPDPASILFEKPQDPDRKAIAAVSGPMVHCGELMPKKSPGEKDAVVD